MNVELLLQVKEAILAHPRKYDQDGFCGQRPCIGGHAVAIADANSWKQWRKDKMAAMVIRDRAQVLLELNARQMHRLCSFASDWPHEFAHDYCFAKSAKDRAAIAGKRIDLFISSGGSR